MKKISQKSINKTFEKADNAISQGKLWRAKEIYQGSIGTYGYHQDLYENYGKLLNIMGDKVEAGRFLFLSGKNKAQHEEAIQLFLGKFISNDPQNILRTFPKSARLPSISNYPESVSAVLKELGINEDGDLFWNNDNPFWNSTNESSWSEKITGVSLAVVLGLCLMCFVIGAYTVGRWLLIAIFK